MPTNSAMTLKTSEIIRAAKFKYLAAHKIMLNSVFKNFPLAFNF